MNLSKAQKQKLYKIKKHKDLGFLLDLKEQKPVEHVTKYLIKQGEGQIMSQIKVPLQVHFSYQKYDYNGKWMFRAIKKGLSLPYAPKQNDRQQYNMAMCLSSMKLNQVSWFNIEQKEKGENSCSSFAGYHYEITLQEETYKNDDTFESKKLVYEDYRQKGKILFQQRKYKDAMKLYQKSINILSGLSKKFFNPEQLKILTDYLEKSQGNYLKCVAKISGFAGRHKPQISKITKQLSEKFMKKYPTSTNSYYQKAIYLKYESRFDDAVDAIQQGLKQTFNQDPEQAKKQKNSLKNMLEQIKKTKQRNIRHLHRQEIRNRKAERRNKDVWDDEQIQMNSDANMKIPTESNWDQQITG